MNHPWPALKRTAASALLAFAFAFTGSAVALTDDAETAEENVIDFVLERSQKRTEIAEEIGEREWFDLTEEHEGEPETE
jgi:hypothetical protein